MNITSIINNIKLPIPKTMAVKFDKYKPDIMIGAGIVLVVGSAVYACKKTIDAKDIVDEAQDQIHDINYGQDIAKGHEDFDERAARRERMTVYRRMGFKLAKCYGPSIIGGATGIALILGAHKIEKDRNAAIGVAYANLLASYKGYRNRVREEFGEDAEKDICAGVRVQDANIIDEEGNVTESVKIKTIDDGSGHSPYARVFDATSVYWSSSPSSNLTFLKSIQNQANDKLRAEGVVFLNDIYRALGFKMIPEGQLVGWVWNSDHGDNYIDFGIFEGAKHSQEIRDFINGYEQCIWIDFNVDGVVYDLL